MPWMSDEAWEMVSDSIEKKSVARSARNMRTHNGKRGTVKFPSDYKSRKELKAMNGEVETYRMNAPMSWEEFEKMPLDLQRSYINHLREKFNAPDQYVAEMFGKSHSAFIDHLFRLKMPADKWMEGNTWDREGFMAWRLGVDVGETEPVPVVETVVDILDRPMDFKQFKKLTDEQQKEYIERLRQKFDIPNKYIARMLGCSESCVFGYARKLNAGFSRPNGSKRPWDETGFNLWLTQDVDLDDCDDDAAIDIPEEPEQGKLDAFVQDLQELSAEVAEGSKTHPAITLGDTESKCVEIPKSCPVPIIPRTGDMNFVGDADDILTTLKTLLSGSRVNLTVSWDIVLTKEEK